MLCPSENALSAFMEGRLSAAERSAVHAHLDTCADCREAVSGAVAGASVAPPGPDRSALTDPAATARGADRPAADASPPRIEGYRIQERIGRGAMGEVYHALDEQLERPVAIKLLFATSDPGARKRFLNEARAVARMRHPNIVTIYSSDISGERPYIVSELLSGRSLDRLPLPLPGEEVLQIASSLAGGLAAAHKQGILHRDIKPANAMRTLEGEVKLLDFGLAKLADRTAEPSEQAQEGRAGPELVQRTMTRTGALVGTPLYMAPEIWEGQPATAASDVYSLGALLYELCAGHPARRSTSFDALREEITGARPEPLHRSAPALDPAFAAIIERCLARDPGERFPSAVELSAELERIGNPRAPVEVKREPPPRSPSRRRFLTLGGALLGLGVTLSALRRLSPGDAPRPSLPARPSASRGTRRSLAIFPFDDAAGSADAAWLGTALPELLGACFAAAEALRIVPGDEVARMRVDLELRYRPSLGADDLRRIRDYLAADLLVVGSFERGGEDGGLHASAQALDTSTGAALGSAEAAGSVAAFRDLALQLGGRLLPRLGQLPLSETQAAEIRAAMPESPLAARLYAEGLERYRANDFEAARDRLRRAIGAEPASPMPHHRLATLSLSLGREEEARAEARLAIERASGLLREQRLQIEALSYRAQQDKTRAGETLRMLCELFPDNVEYGIDLAQEQPREEGLATLARLRALPPPAGEDPRIDITEYLIGAVLSDGLSAVRRAGEKGRARGARLIVGQAASLEGWVLYDLGELDQAVETLERSLPILEARGDVFNASEAMRALGGIAVARGDLDAALRRYEQAESILASIGNHASYAYALRNVASAHQRLGDTATARRKLEESRHVGERSSNQNRLAQTYWILGAFEHLLGNMAEARAAFERALSIAEGLHDRWLARMFQGDLGRFYLASDELEKARAALEWAISGKDAEGRRRSAAPNRRDLALLLLEEGRHDDALRLAGEALAEVERERATVEIALAAGVKARVLAARGDHPGAALLADGALATLERSKNVQARVQVTLDWAQVRALGGDHARMTEADATLSEAASAARRAGFGAFVAEARFIACELLAARGERAPARACFSRIAAEARATGFALLARKAGAAAG